MSNSEQSEIAKLVWKKLKYTHCNIHGKESTLIELADVWELIRELEIINYNEEIASWRLDRKNIVEGGLLHENENKKLKAEIERLNQIILQAKTK